jgi:hypothetical protein
VPGHLRKSTKEYPRVVRLGATIQELEEQDRGITYDYRLDDALTEEAKPEEVKPEAQAAPVATEDPPIEQVVSGDEEFEYDDEDGDEFDVDEEEEEGEDEDEVEDEGGDTESGLSSEVDGSGKKS